MTIHYCSEAVVYAVYRHLVADVVAVVLPEALNLPEQHVDLIVHTTPKRRGGRACCRRRARALHAYCRHGLSGASRERRCAGAVHVLLHSSACVAETAWHVSPEPGGVTSGSSTGRWLPRQNL